MAKPNSLSAFSWQPNWTQCTALSNFARITFIQLSLNWATMYTHYLLIMLCMELSKWLDCLDTVPGVSLSAGHRQIDCQWGHFLLPGLTIFMVNVAKCCLSAVKRWWLTGTVTHKERFFLYSHSLYVNHIELSKWRAWNKFLTTLPISATIRS